MFNPSKLFIDQQPTPAIQPKEEGWRHILLLAADVIRKQGWCKKFHEGEGNAVCAVGAIHVACGSVPHQKMNDCGEIVPFFEPSWPKEALVAGDQLSEYIGRDVPLWNDRPERTKEEVIEALEGAAYAHVQTTPTF